MHKPPLLLVVLCLAAAPPLVGQISIVSSGAGAAQVNLGGSYTQNFDNFGTGSVAFANNSTLPGWYVTAAASETSFAASTGSGTTGAVYNFGASSATDRSWGYLGGRSNNWTNFGLRFINNTNQTITSISVSYQGELWRSGGAQPSNSNNDFVFLYQIGTPASISLPDSVLTGAGWQQVTDLTYAPIVSQAAGAVDGNLYATSETADFAVTFLPGEEIWLRWYGNGANTGGTTAGLAIDDVTVSFTAVPEPSATITLLGLAALTSAALRRRRGTQVERLPETPT